MFESFKLFDNTILSADRLENHNIIRDKNDKDHSPQTANKVVNYHGLTIRFRSIFFVFFQKLF